MKLIVQIPCFNEAETIGTVISAIPREIPGLDCVEVLVIDDGSTDDTAAVARQAGADHVLRNKSNLGLARTFQRGLNAALKLGADVIVNTDGDNQYGGSSIPALVLPVVEGRADIVIGDRRPSEIEAFSPLKRRLQKLGSAVVRRLSGLDVTDAVSGFRAYSRDAALVTNVMTTFSYTTETLIHAGHKGMTVVSVPVTTNPVTRESRLAGSMRHFLQKQIITIIRSYTMYRPLRAFFLLGMIMLVIGVIPIARFLYFFLIGQSDGHIQSLVLGSMFFVVGYITLVIALLGDTIATNRQLIEMTLERIRRLEDVRTRECDDA